MILLTVDHRPSTILTYLLTYFLYNDLLPVKVTLRVRENIVLHTFTVSSLVWDSREDSGSGNRQTRKQTSTKPHIHHHDIRHRRTMSRCDYQYLLEHADAACSWVYAYVCLRAFWVNMHMRNGHCDVEDKSLLFFVPNGGTGLVFEDHFCLSCPMVTQVLF